VQREDVLDGFEFEQNGVLDEDVGLVAFVETEAVEDEREGDFALDAEAVFLEGVAEALVVDGFQQAGAELAVDVDGDADDFFGEVGAGFLGHGVEYRVDWLIGG
jgi:hypothetical protein